MPQMTVTTTVRLETRTVLMQSYRGSSYSLSFGVKDKLAGTR
jgi:hypothetical protein